MNPSDFYTRLLDACVKPTRDYGIVGVNWLQPNNGIGGQISPPTFPPHETDGDRSLHHVEKRYFPMGDKPDILADGEVTERKVIVIDSETSSANRQEETVYRANLEGGFPQPWLSTLVPVWTDPYHVLQMPNRCYDEAVVRSTNGDGKTLFPRTTEGLDLFGPDHRKARLQLLQTNPAGAVYGCWNVTGGKGAKEETKKAKKKKTEDEPVVEEVKKEREVRSYGLKVPSAVRMEVLGFDPILTQRRGCRGTPLQLQDAKDMMSSLPIFDKDRGASVKVIRETWLLSFPTLRTFETNQKADDPVYRAYLAAYALFAYALSTASDTPRLRKGCDLRYGERTCRWQGTEERFDVQSPFFKEVYHLAMSNASRTVDLSRVVKLEASEDFANQINARWGK